MASAFLVLPMRTTRIVTGGGVPPPPFIVVHNDTNVSTTASSLQTMRESLSLSLLSTNIEGRERDLVLFSEDLTAAMSGYPNLFCGVKIRVGPSLFSH